MYGWKTLSHSVRSLFTALLVSSTVKKLLSFLKSHLSIVGLNSWAYGVLFLKSPFLHLYLVDYYVCFYSSTCFDPLGVTFCSKWWIQVQFRSLACDIQFSCHHLLHTFLFSNVFGSPVPKHVLTLRSWRCFCSLRVWVGAITEHCFWHYYPGSAVQPEVWIAGPLALFFWLRFLGLPRVFCDSIRI